MRLPASRFTHRLARLTGGAALYVSLYFCAGHTLSAQTNRHAQAPVSERGNVRQQTGRQQAPASARAAVTATAAAETATTAPTLTLREQWQHVRQMLQRNDHTAALDGLDTLAAHFSREPEYLQILPLLLPLYAELCLAQDRAADAASLCRQWLELPSSTPAQPEYTLMLEMLAHAHEQSGDHTTAIATLSRIVEAPDNSATDATQRQLARLQIASLQARSGQTEQALEALAELSTTPGVPPQLQQEAALRAIWLCLENHLNERAAAILLAYDRRHRQATAQPALLALAVLRIGNHLLHNDRSEDALHAFTLVPPHAELRRRQQQSHSDLVAAHHALQQRARDGSAQARSTLAFVRAQLARSEEAGRTLAQMPNFTQALFFARAQVHLQAQQPWEAAVLFAAAATPVPTATSAVQTEETASIADEAQARLPRLAQYRRLLALRQAGREHTLQKEAQQFADAHAAHPLAADALYLRAESLRRQKHYSQAIAVLDALLERPVTDAAHMMHTVTRWFFERGYCKAMLGEYTGAQSDFAAAAAYADQPLQDWASYWSAQTHLLAADYVPAEAALQTALEQIDSSHPSAPYAHFAYAQALYANSKATEAHAELSGLISRFPTHERSAPAQLLLAEALAALGRTDEALSQLQTVYALAVEPWSAQALFRQGEMLEDLGRTQNALELYLGFTAALLSPEAGTGDSATGANTSLSRYAPAVERAAGAYTALDNPVAAAALVSKALIGHGNNPATGNFEPLLARAWSLALDPQTLLPAQETQSRRRQLLHKAADSNDSSSSSNLFRDSYALWLNAARTNALEQGHKTRYARISLALSNHYQRQLQHELALVPLLETAAHTTPADLDTQTLEALTVLLAERGHSQADHYADALAARHSGQATEPAALQWSRALLADPSRSSTISGTQADAVLEHLRLLETDWPTHPLRARAIGLRADIRTRQGDNAAAEADWLSLLSLPTSTPQQRADALLSLARLHAGTAPAAAIAYYQRLYTLYRADPSALFRAYTESAQLFEQIGDAQAAAATYAELLTTLAPHLSTAQKQNAETAHARLVALPRDPAAPQATAPTTPQPPAQGTP